ncbi:MAG: 2-C-methyl-D-erythritol 4-phosphate cytidylyltransferase [Francisellaceae bacterium]
MKRIAVIAASGIGQRVGGEKPKQYLELDNGLTILDTTLTRLLVSSFFDYIIVALNQNDRYWQHSRFAGHSRILTTLGGDERSDSVRNALLALKNIADDDDWICIHDAARPCIDLDDVRRLYAMIRAERAIGGILALPVTDTIKRVNAKKNITATLDRNALYLAQTPQIFQYKTLIYALYFCGENEIKITDDAQAVEALDHQPIIVEGKKSNIKITVEEDIDLANYYLTRI